MSKEAEKFIEKYTTKDQNDWLVEKKDIIARFMESYHTEQLTLTDVSQQRELLIDFADAINIHDGDRVKIGKLVDLHLKSINCG